MKSLFWLIRLFAVMTLLAALPVRACAKSPGALASRQADLVANQFKPPMCFEANQRQAADSVKFFAHAAAYNLYLRASETVLSIPKFSAGKRPEFLAVRMKLLDANDNPSIRGLDILSSRSNYFLGTDSARWRTGVEQYSKVAFGQVYPGVDMVYRFNQGNIEYDFIVAPGADPGRILMAFDGADSIRLDSQNNLILGVGGGELTYKAPKLYQHLDGMRVPVKGRFLLSGNNQVKFEVGDYVKSKELIIDPELVYSSYLGGTVDDKAYALTVDVCLLTFLDT